jgi:hypothetical protein
MFFLLKKTYKQIVKKINERLINKHINAVSDPRSIKKFVELMIYFTNIKPEVVFEIGANHGQDGEGLRHYFAIQPECVWVQSVLLKNI